MRLWRNSKSSLPGIGVDIFILRHVHVQSPCAGHDVSVVNVASVSSGVTRLRQCWTTSHHWTVALRLKAQVGKKWDCVNGRRDSETYCNINRDRDPAYINIIIALLLLLNSDKALRCIKTIRIIIQCYLLRNLEPCELMRLGNTSRTRTLKCALYRMGDISGILMVTLLWQKSRSLHLKFCYLLQHLSEYLHLNWRINLKSGEH